VLDAPDVLGSLNREPVLDVFAQRAIAVGRGRDGVPELLALRAA
jgi:hypothetical protein